MQHTATAEKKENELTEHEKNNNSLFFIAGMQTAFAQTLDIDSILKKIGVEKDEYNKIDLAVSLLLIGLDKDPYITIKTG